MDAPPSLSAQLRERTAPLHGQIEVLLRLPGAIRTFGDYETVGPMWQSFRAALDEFSLRQPQLCNDVVIGAERTLQAMLVWFAPFGAKKVGQS